MKPSMDRKTLKVPFTLNTRKNWACPTCQSGVLRINGDTFHKYEIHNSRDHSHDGWDPDWISLTFSCMLTCTNPHCKETVSCAGVGTVDQDYVTDENGEVEPEYRDSFTPRYFEPHLRLIEIPEGCPESVSALLNESFKLFFCSPSAASNNVRMAIEELLTELKVRRFNLVAKQRRFISLHQRIELLPSQYAQLKDLILAIKWLGNAGSHANGKISMDDVMDSYDMFEHVLEQIYMPKTKKLRALAKQVNKNKGPAKKMTRSFL